MNRSKRIIAHCLIRNEERWIWYSVRSLLPYVDKIMIWDMGSTDKTIDILKTIKSNKVDLKIINNPIESKFTEYRQQMLDSTKSKFDWLMILDGDEIWPKDSITKVVSLIQESSELESIVVRTNNLVGDIYHRLPESSGFYNLAGRKGHLNLRFINLEKIDGLHVQHPHGQQGYFDINNKLIQDRDPKKIKFLDVYYHHATHLPRSKNDYLVQKRLKKYKFVIGEKIPSNQIPEIFYSPRPKIVEDVTQKAGFAYIIMALLISLPRAIKSKYVKRKDGY